MMFVQSSVAVLLVAGLRGVVGAVTPPRTDQGTCQKTTVVILCVLPLSVELLWDMGANLTTGEVEWRVSLLRRLCPIRRCTIS